MESKYYKLENDLRKYSGMSAKSANRKAFEDSVGNYTVSTPKTANLKIAEEIPDIRAIPRDDWNHKYDRQNLRTTLCDWHPQWKEKSSKHRRRPNQNKTRSSKESKNDHKRK